MSTDLAFELLPAQDMDEIDKLLAEALPTGRQVEVSEQELVQI